MQAKLTLKLDGNAVNQAKKYAFRTHQSLSSIVEGYFKSLTADTRKSPEVSTPIVDSLTGSIKGPRNRDLKTEYTAYLEKKYE